MGNYRIDNSVLTDGGSNISAGQRQLLTIARAMIKKPLLLFWIKPPHSGGLYARMYMAGMAS
ncbi:MAG: hypothetical protein PHZ09_03735 [Eubacteriales bacterium]|nr:hypothetical protein [Eubacteriales bacterium]